MRPLIGMTMWIAAHDDRREYPTPYTFEFLHRAYAEMIRRAGGVPVLLPNPADPEEVERLVGALDGLLLTGGEDLEPHRFKEDVQTKTLELAPDRDQFEIMAVQQADKIGLPILGICRGIQSLNVAYGGSLYQDLLEQREKPTNNHSRGGLFYRRFHDVTIEKATRLYEIIGDDKIRVSTAHHQAVKDLGRDLQVNAHAPEDRVIEGVEVPGQRFVLAVQWHPEIMPEDDQNTQRLAEAFITAARRG
jgi:putative glutamine amidotransferase